MSYTIVSRSTPSYAEVVPTVLDALILARKLSHDDDDKVTILSDSGWVLTLDELENLVTN